VTEADSYPIREFARITGVNPVTLRAWERRYGIIQPLRTPKGHRYYTDDHVAQVKDILYWLDQGYPIRQVKLLLTDPPATAEAPADDWANMIQRMLKGACELNSRAIDEELNAGLASYPMAVFYDRCLTPVLGALRQDPQRQLIQQNFSYLLQRKLAQLICLQQKHAEGPLLLIATNHPEASIHMLAAAYALGAAGFRVEFFGPSLTTEQLMITAEIINASWIWAHLHPSDTNELQQWQRMITEAGLPVYFSGAAPVGLPDDMHLQDSIGRQIQGFIQTAGGKL